MAPPRKPARKPDGREVLEDMGRRARVSRKRAPGARPKPAGGSRGFGQAVRSWTRWLILGSLAGATLGGTAVLGTMYRHAVAVVDARMDGAIWTVPGLVVSAPMEVWPGLALTPAELGEDLRRAGYAVVSEARAAGDVVVEPGRVRVRNRAVEVPGAKVPAGEVVVDFADGRVAKVTVGRDDHAARAVFAPMTLATVRGADNETRSPVPLERIPQHVRRAVMAMEDARFYEHPGIDAMGVARALWVNLVTRGPAQGGSSLTQQLAKNLFLTPERTASRKIQEALLALALERSLTKDEILRLYLNEVYFGEAGGTSLGGVDAAARAFFGVPVEKLDLGQAATLGGIISSPNPYSPVRHPDTARVRRDLTLTRMAALRWVTPEEAAAAKAAPLQVRAARGGRVAPWVVDAAVEAVEAELGDGALARDALTVHTSLQPALQRLAERAVSEGMAALVKAHPGLAEAEAAMAVVRVRDGAVVALVGGRDYARSAFDRASAARRQVGSTVKPLTMLAAFEADETLSPALELDDSPLERVHDGTTWTPRNYDDTFVGPLSLREAIARSRNIPAVLLAERVGLPALRDHLHALGLSGATDYPSVALGGFPASPLQLAGAYAIFGGLGYHAPWMVRAALPRPSEAAGAEGARPLRNASPGASDTAPRGVDRVPPKATVRMSPRATWLSWSVLREVLDTGTGRGARALGVGDGAAGKTGTSDRSIDAWFAGVAGPYAVVAWVGFDKERPLGLTGGQAAVPVWGRFVAWSGAGAEPPPPPESVEQGEVCADDGLLRCDCDTRRPEWFPVGAAPVGCEGPSGEDDRPPRILPTAARSGTPADPARGGPTPGSRDDAATEPAAEESAWKRLSRWALGR
jgi:penicillin-binding protein 1B